MAVVSFMRETRASKLATGALDRPIYPKKENALQDWDVFSSGDFGALFPSRRLCHENVVHDHATEAVSNDGHLNVSSRAHEGQTWMNNSLQNISKIVWAFLVESRVCAIAAV